MNSRIKAIVEASIQTKQELLNDTTALQTLDRLSSVCSEAFKNGKKILFCGNGGSAADAQHLAAELSGRFYTDRPPLYAEALHVNSSYITAVANDYSFDVVYSRMVQAAGKEGDLLIGLSTSGNSPNVIKALEMARSLKMITIGFSGSGGGKMIPLCDYLLRAPSTDTPRIQECHILMGHILCQLIEERLFPAK